jgi:AraC-like DNA-binding protein
MPEVDPLPDVLSDILASLKLKGSLYFATEFSAPWGVRVPRLGDVTRFHLVMRGGCWVKVGREEEPTHLESGDLVLVPHGAEHVLSDVPRRAAVLVDDVLKRAGFKGRGSLVFGGPDRGMPTRLLCGHFEFEEGLSHPFIRKLPARIVIRRDEAARHPWFEDVLRLIEGEARTGRPGSEAVVMRLSEILFIQSVRVWAEDSGHPPGVMAALADAAIGRSLASFHGDPGRAWTLESLAREAGLSRSLFAGRFRSLMGLTPMQYVASWRVQEARELLRREGATLGEVAGLVGYASVAAFSRVFKKWVGASPGRYGRGVRGARWAAGRDIERLPG